MGIIKGASIEAPFIIAMVSRTNRLYCYKEKLPVLLSLYLHLKYLTLE